MYDRLMMKSVFNQGLVRVSGLSLQQIKRCAITLFGVDPEVGQASGVPRAYRLDDGFLIFLMGVLVDGYRLRLQDAKNYVWEIFRELDRRGLFPSTLRQYNKVPEIEVNIYPGGIYEFREILERNIAGETNWNEGEETVATKYISRWVPPTAIDERPKGPEYHIHISSLLMEYSRAMEVMS